MLTKRPPGDIVSDPEMAKELAQFVEDMDPDWGVCTGGDPRVLTDKLKELQEKLDRYETRVARLKVAQKIKDELHEDELKGLQEMIVCLREEIRCLKESMQIEQLKLKEAQETVKESREQLELQEAKIRELQKANERMEQLMAAITEILAYAGVSTVLFLLSYHAVPDRFRSAKMVGYALAAGLATRAAVRLSEYLILGI